jgi:hypothetical protein
VTDLPTVSCSSPLPWLRAKSLAMLVKFRGGAGGGGPSRSNGASPRRRDSSVKIILSARSDDLPRARTRCGSGNRVASHVTADPHQSSPRIGRVVTPTLVPGSPSLGHAPSRPGGPLSSGRVGAHRAPPLGPASYRVSGALSRALSLSRSLALSLRRRSRAAYAGRAEPEPGPGRDRAPIGPRPRLT